MNQDFPFQVGETYTNRLGRYRVLELKPPIMRVQYEHGGTAELNITTQSRIMYNMNLEQTVPAAPPAPPPRSRTTPARATATAAPRVRAPRATPVRAATTRSTAGRSTAAGRAAVPLWTGVREAPREARAVLLRAVVPSEEAFMELIDNGLETERGRYWLSTVADVQALNVAEPLNRTSPPDLFLAASIVQDRGYLTTPHHIALARQFPIHEGSDTRQTVDLLGYDDLEERPILTAVRVRTTAAQWLWEALFAALEGWVALRATPSFAASLGEYPLNAAPALGVIAPRAYWLEQDPARSATARAHAALSRDLITAIRTWLHAPVLLMEVDDDWLRRVGTPGQPGIRPAAFSEQ
jgi:hypothetical protein